MQRYSFLCLTAIYKFLASAITRSYDIKINIIYEIITLVLRVFNIKLDFARQENGRAVQEHETMVGLMQKKWLTLHLIKTKRGHGPDTNR